jgi:hypothetical protein
MTDRHDGETWDGTGPSPWYWADGRNLKPEDERVIMRALREQIRQLEEKIALRKQSEGRGPSG